MRLDLLKTDLHETLLDLKVDNNPGGGGQTMGLLDVMTMWLTPVDPKSLPLLVMRSTLYKCLNQLPGTGFQVDHLICPAVSRCTHPSCLLCCVWTHSAFRSPEKQQDW